MLPRQTIEALGRLMATIGPWLELGGDSTTDFLNFASVRQPLVDAAFLAQRAWSGQPFPIDHALAT